MLGEVSRGDMTHDAMVRWINNGSVYAKCIREMTERKKMHTEVVFKDKVMYRVRSISATCIEVENPHQEKVSFDLEPNRREKLFWDYFVLEEVQGHPVRETVESYLSSMEKSVLEFLDPIDSVSKCDVLISLYYSAIGAIDAPSFEMLTSRLRIDKDDERSVKAIALTCLKLIPKYYEALLEHDLSYYKSKYSEWK